MKLLASVLLAFTLGGCGTLMQSSSRDGPAIYGGLRAFCGERGLLFFLLLPDLPFTFVLDTVFLPASMINELVHGGIEANYSISEQLGGLGAVH